MKKLLLIMVLVAGCFVSTSFGQARAPQMEIFGGVAIPLAPEGFKDYFKMGFSPHFQYVMFPTQKLGISFGVDYEYFTFDDGKIKSDFDDLGITGVDITGGASNVEFSIGIRPYITDPEASTQIFLYAMGTYNLLSQESEIDYDSYWESFGLVDEKITDDTSEPGFGGGVGMEIPAGDSFNLIIQGVFRSILTEDESTNFLGLSAGIVF